MNPQHFAIPPASTRLVWLLPVLSTAAVLIGIGVLALREPQAWIALPVAAGSLAFIALVFRRRRVSVEDGVLTVAAGLNTRRIAVGDLDLASARVVDLREHTELRPSIKLFGTRVPGLSMGHFRLRSPDSYGGHRAFVLLTDPSRVLVLSERSGRRLLLSLARPQALLDALQPTSTDPRIHHR